MKPYTPPANTEVHCRVHKSSPAPFYANKIHAEHISIKSTLIVLYLTFSDNLYLHFPYIHTPASLFFSRWSRSAGVACEVPTEVIIYIASRGLRLCHSCSTLNLVAAGSSETSILIYR
jgi:hypothetical protein